MYGVMTRDGDRVISLYETAEGAYAQLRAEVEAIVYRTSKEIRNITGMQNTKEQKARLEASAQEQVYRQLYVKEVY